jgi:AraC-like DNA-binding protein
MLIRSYLTLQLITVQPGTNWPYPHAPTSRRLLFVFIKSGCGQFASGATELALVPGDVFTWSPDGEGKLLAESVGEWVFWSFSLASENLYPLFANQELYLVQAILDSLRKPKVYGASTPSAQACHRLLADTPGQFNLDHRAHLLRVVASLLTAEYITSNLQQAGLAQPRNQLTQAFEGLSNEDLLNLSIAELAKKFDCSRRHLSRLFKQHFGLSVAALRMEMRLLKAASLLRNPSSKVIQVAEQSGFTHLGLFNLCFKRRFSSTPGQWRNANATQEVSPKALVGNLLLFRDANNRNTNSRDAGPAESPAIGTDGS